MTRRGIETLVGLFVLAGFVAIGYLALKAANLAAMTVGETYVVTARFDNIGGLKPRAPVKSAGVTVGRVTRITLDPQTFQGVVTMQIQRGFQFPKDSSAKILTSGLLGDQYVGLDPGGAEDNLADGQVITQTQSGWTARRWRMVMRTGSESAWNVALIFTIRLVVGRRLQRPFIPPTSSSSSWIFSGNTVRQHAGSFLGSALDFFVVIPHPPISN